MVTIEVLGTAARHARITQAEVAARMGVTQGRVSAIEHARGAIDSTLIMSAARSRDVQPAPSGSRSPEKWLVSCFAFLMKYSLRPRFLAGSESGNHLGGVIRR